MLKFEKKRKKKLKKVIVKVNFTFTDIFSWEFPWTIIIDAAHNSSLCCTLGIHILPPSSSWSSLIYPVLWPVYGWCVTHSRVQAGSGVRSDTSHRPVYNTIMSGHKPPGTDHRSDGASSERSSGQQNSRRCHLSSNARTRMPENLLLLMTLWQIFACLRPTGQAEISNTAHY